MNTFKSREQLTEFLDNLAGLKLSKKNVAPFNTFYFPCGTYYLNHGEYEQPEYTICKYKDGWGVYVKFFYYNGTHNAPLSARVTDLQRLEELYK
jgi:hypothetical protein